MFLNFVLVNMRWLNHAFFVTYVCVVLTQFHLRLRKYVCVELTQFDLRLRKYYLYFFSFKLVNHK
jgi:hypothetical protein